jgi:hypothetical protein
LRLGESRRRRLAKPQAAAERRMSDAAHKWPGLWIGAAAAGLLGVALVVAVGALMHDDVVSPPAPPPAPPVVPTKVDPQPARDPRDQILEQAAAHWQLGLGPQHPKYPLLPAGAIEANLPAEGAGARPDAKVARLADACFDAGRKLAPAGDALTVYLRVRDALGRWDHGLFAKRGSAVKVAFNLFSGDVPPLTGPDIGFEVRTEAAYAKVSFPVTSIDASAWHDLVGRYDGQKLQIICDGKVLDEKPLQGAIKQNDEPVLIGAESVQGRAVRRFTGEMEEAALWTHALSDAELAQLMRTDKVVLALTAPAQPKPTVTAVQGLVEVKPGEVYRNGSLALFIKITPDGRYALFQQPDGIAVWGIEENRPLRALKVANILLSHAAVSADGKRFAVALPNGRVSGWEIESGERLPELNHGANIYALAFSPDAATLLTSGGGGPKQAPSIKRWDIRTGSLAQTLEGHRAPALALAVNDQHVLATDASGLLYRWEAQAGKLLDSRQLDSKAVVRFAPDGKWLAHLRADRLMLREPATDRELRGAPLTASVEPHPYFDVTPDGRLALVAQAGTNNLEVYDLVKGARVETLTGHQAPVRAVAISPDGRRAYSSDAAKMFHVWKLDDGATRSHP